MTVALPSWVVETASLPIAFAQVREDPLLDREVIERLPGAARVLMVASGGCTAALLAASPNVTRLHLVDPNPAQLALTRLKLHLLQTATPADRLALLGHAPLPAEDRRQRGTAWLGSLGLAPDALGPVDLWAQVGPDQVGATNGSSRSCGGICTTRPTT